MNAMIKSVLEFLKRASVGFIAGYIVACFVLVFLGQWPPGHDLSQPEFEQQARSHRLAFYIACGMAMATVAAGSLKLSKFWLWFCIAFGVISIIPFWPGKDGSLMPLATPYVNSGFHAFDVYLLAIHVAVAMAIAAKIQWGWPRLFKRISPTSQPATEADVSASGAKSHSGNEL